MHNNNIKFVYTDNIVYTSDKSSYRDDDKLTISNCTFDKTNYGSVIIKRKHDTKIIELYPNKISHIIYI